MAQIIENHPEPNFSPARNFLRLTRVTRRIDFFRCISGFLFFLVLVGIFGCESLTERDSILPGIQVQEFQEGSRKKAKVEVVGKIEKISESTFESGKYCQKKFLVTFPDP
jgi:hypothetical protein